MAVYAAQGKRNSLYSLPKLTQNPAEMKNTRHSSCKALNTFTFNGIEADEWLTTHQGLVIFVSCWLNACLKAVFAFCYSISLAIQAHASASARAWWWFFMQKPQAWATVCNWWFGKEGNLRRETQRVSRNS